MVIDVNNTPGPSHQNVHWRELAVRILAEKLGLHTGADLRGEVRATAAAPELVERAVAVTLAAATTAPVVATQRDSSRRAEGRRNILPVRMIVKNESEVLPRLFRSLKDYIDYYVIVDTGSTDDTIALIEREMRGYRDRG